MRQLMIDYLLRPLVRPLTRFVVKLAAVPAFYFFFRHVAVPERLHDEVEKDLAEWFRGCLLLMLATANMEIMIWDHLLALIHWEGFQTLLERHEWVVPALRIMLALAVVQTMPDQDLFTITHPGPRPPRFKPNETLRAKLLELWRSVGIGFMSQLLSRTAPVFAILTVILDGPIGWVCYTIAILQYLVIGLVTSRDRAADVLMLFDKQVAARRRELVRQVRVIDCFNHSEAIDAPEVPTHRDPSCGD